MRDSGVENEISGGLNWLMERGSGAVNFNPGTQLVPRDMADRQPWMPVIRRVGW